MALRILLLESSKLHASSLKSRLVSVGAELVLAASKAELDSLSGPLFDLAVSDSQLPGCSEEEHFALLRKSAEKVWLWSDDEALLGDSARQIRLGIGKAFRKLNRADLIHACENLMKKATSAAEGPRNFLLVEDSPTVRAYVRRVLQDRFPSSKVLEAEDGRAAVELMKAGPIDLVLTDLQMPGMDGASFVQLLRRDGALARTPIVILSGMITAKVRDEMAGMPRLCFLPKPASPDAVEEAVRGLLQGEGTPA